MYTKECVLVVDGELFGQEVIKAVFRAAGCTAPAAGLVDEMRIQTITPVGDDLSLEVRIVHVDLWSMQDFYVERDDGFTLRPVVQLEPQEAAAS